MLYKYIAPATIGRCYVYFMNWMKTDALSQKNCSELSQNSIIKTSSQ